MQLPPQPQLATGNGGWREATAVGDRQPLLAAGTNPLIEDNATLVRCELSYLHVDQADAYWYPLDATIQIGAREGTGGINHYYQSVGYRQPQLATGNRSWRQNASEDGSSQGSR